MTDITTELCRLWKIIHRPNGSQSLHRFASRIHGSDRTDYDCYTTGLISAEDWQNELNHLVLNSLLVLWWYHASSLWLMIEGDGRIPRIGFLEQSRRG